MNGSPGLRACLPRERWPAPLWVTQMCKWQGLLSHTSTFSLSQVERNADSWRQKLQQPLKGELFRHLNQQLSVLMQLLRTSLVNWASVYVQHRCIIVYVHPSINWSMNAELCRKVQWAVGYLGEVLTHYSWKDCTKGEESEMGLEQGEPTFSVEEKLQKLCVFVTIWQHTVITGTSVPSFLFSPPFSSCIQYLALLCRPYVSGTPDSLCCVYRGCSTFTLQKGYCYFRQEALITV